MYFISLVNVPFGYCRVNQKYVIDINDFLLVEILLCVLILIMAKGIFEVKLSKLQFAINETEEADKYMIDPPKSEISDKLSKSLTQKSTSKVPDESVSSNLDYRSLKWSLPSNLAVDANKSSTTSNGSSDFNPSLKSFLEYKSFHSSMGVFRSSGSGFSSNPATASKQDMKTEQTAQPERIFTKPLRVFNVVPPPHQVQILDIRKDTVNSTGTFTLKFNSSKSSATEQPTSNTSKLSKSVTQVLNPSQENPEQQQPVCIGGSPAEVGSQRIRGLELTSKNKPQKTMPIRALRNSIKNAGADVMSKNMYSHPS